MIADGLEFGVARCFMVLGRAIFRLMPPNSGLAIKEVWAEAIEEGHGLSSAADGWLL